MSWRTIIVPRRAKLDLKMNCMVVRFPDETVRVHLDEIYSLIIETTAVSMTAALLNELIKKKVKVIFCDEKRNPSGEIMSYYGSHDTSSKYRNQLKWSKETKAKIWKEIVKEKINNQMKLLKSLGLIEYKMLEGYYENVEYNDRTNREGHAAKVYFNALFGKNFSRNTENNINAALDYSYAILLSTINRELASMGYMTQIGIFHDNVHNKFNLSCDLMEPFRIYFDKHIIQMNLDRFDVLEKREIISLIQGNIKMDNKNMIFNNALKLYCKSVMDALDEDEISLIKYWEYEL